MSDRGGLRYGSRYGVNTTGMTNDQRLAGLAYVHLRAESDAAYRVYRNTQRNADALRRVFTASDQAKMAAQRQLEDELGRPLTEAEISGDESIAVSP